MLNWLSQRELRLVRNSVLRGKGAPSLRGGAVGDQYVTVNVVTPTGLNDRQKAALKEFAAAGDLKVNPKKKGFFDHIKDAFEGE